MMALSSNSSVRWSEEATEALIALFSDESIQIANAPKYFLFLAGLPQLVWLAECMSGFFPPLNIPENLYFFAFS